MYFICIEPMRVFICIGLYVLICIRCMYRVHVCI